MNQRGEDLTAMYSIYHPKERAERLAARVDDMFDNPNVGWAIVLVALRDGRVKPWDSDHGVDVA